ncbi:hypothetical protein ACIQXA_38995 [Streptomyces massasporeus]|uniref:hypothetical protein n=1 Tax=Streptomyces massasporeus TaxID=67324 RepID=UPI00380DCF90
MSGRPVPRPPQRPRKPQPNGNSVDYNVPRWRDDGQLGQLGGKKFVRRATEVSSGREGVLKHMSDPPVPGEGYVDKGRRARRRRFYDEALFMQQVNGSPGILPIWDIDDAHGTAPRWYAMPRARPLADIVDDTSTVLDVVTHTTALARTLAALADQGIYHRDIKPDNLEQQWGHTPWHRARMPRTADQVQQLTDAVVAWISHSSPDAPVAEVPERTAATA